MSHFPRNAIRPSRRLIALLVVLGLPLLASQSVHARPDYVASPSRVHVSGAITEALQRTGWANVLVGLRADVAPTVSLAALANDADMARADVLADLDESEFQLTKRYEYFPLVAGRVSPTGLAKLRANLRVTAIDEDVWVYPLSVNASPAQLRESVPSVGADRVQKMGIRGQGIGVAVVDTGIDTDHPDLVDAIVGQVCFSSATRSCAPGGLPKSDSAEDEQGHGTGVSSIVLGRGKVAPVGMAPEAKLIGVRVFRDQGGAPTQDIVDGLNWVVGKQVAYGIRIVNMSLGGGASLGTNCDDQYANVKQVFQTLVSRNIAIFVATGNGGNSDRVAFPACISNATGVGSTWDTELTLGSPDCHGKTQIGPTDITCYTDRGKAMDIVAPGSIIVTARMGGGATGSGPTQGGHGTSYASPSAAGVAALILSADPKIHARDLERILKDTGDVVIHPESKAEIKRINAYKAVMSVLPATPTPSATVPATVTATALPSVTPGLPSATPTGVTPPTEPPTMPWPTPVDTPVPSATPGGGPPYKLTLPWLGQGATL